MVPANGFYSFRCNSLEASARSVFAGQKWWKIFMRMGKIERPRYQYGGREHKKRVSIRNARVTNATAQFYVSLTDSPISFVYLFIYVYMLFQRLQWNRRNDRKRSKTTMTHYQMQFTVIEDEIDFSRSLVDDRCEAISQNRLNRRWPERQRKNNSVEEKMLTKTFIHSIQMGQF